MRVFPRFRIVLVLVLFGLVLCPIAAQEFGQNNVRYEQFDFDVYRSPTFDVLSYPSLSAAAVDSARMLERWNSRYRELFDHTLSRRQPVILYANHTDFAQTNAIPGRISQGVQGVTEGRGGRVVLPLSPSYRQNNHVLGHELVHAFHFDMVRGRSRGPLWLLEGMAEYATRGPRDNETAMWMRDALEREAVPSLRDLSRRPEYSPYRWGHAVWAYVVGRYGDEVVPEFYRMAVNRGLKPAVREVLNTDVNTLSEDWREFLRGQYAGQLSGATAAEELGRSFAPGGKPTGISPVISPGGRYVAFFGSRTPLSFELIVARVADGEIVGTLSTRSRSEHFDSLRFTYGAGAFSPSGDRLAFVIEQEGRQGIAIADVPTLEIQKTLFFDEIEAVSHLAWSPGGAALAMSAGSGGAWNLYTLALQGERLKQHTDDRFAQIQPSYAPDGESLLYATDRTATAGFDTLSFPGTALEVYDLDTGRRTRLDLPEEAIHASPHFDWDDSDRVYFVSDLQGVANLYSYDRSNGELRRLTDLATGISGLSGWSPALSVAADGDLAVATVFRDGETQMRRLSIADLSTRKRELRIDPKPSPSLSPGVRPGIVADYLDRPGEGLPGAERVRTSDYSPTLRVSEVQEFFVGLGASAYGTALYGGVSLAFADLLGDHRLGVGVRMYGDLERTSAGVSYRNRKRRIGWGIDASHIPSEDRVSVTETENVEVGGETREAEVTTTVRDRTVSDSVDLVAEYPFSRNLRVEGKLGYTHVRIEQVVQEVAREPDGEFLVSREERTRPVDPLDLMRTPLALVGDYSVRGYTGPLKGSRFRLEGEPTFGSARYISALADYRHYFYLRPFSLAVRAIHEGRYLPSGRTEAISPLNLGFPTLLRGYEPWTFDDSDNPAYRSTRGTRLLAANAELRAPLFGRGDVGLIDARPFPLTFFGFADAGAAWFGDDFPNWKLVDEATERVPLLSSGFGGRVNFGNVISLEIYWAYAFQRPSRDSVTGFQFRSGF